MGHIRKLHCFIWQVFIESNQDTDVHLSLVAALIFGSCKLLLGFPAVGLNLTSLSEVHIVPYAQMEGQLPEGVKDFLIFIITVFVLGLFETHGIFFPP